MQRNNNLDVEIIDDFLPPHLHNYIEDVLSSPHYPYHFIPDVTYSSSKKTRKKEQCPGDFPLDKLIIGFAATPFQDYRADRKEFAYFQMFETMVRQVLPTTHDWVLNRLRVGINVPQSSHHNQWDVDYDCPHIDHHANGLGGDTIVALYYVNETDGDTVIFNEQGLDPPQRLTIKQRVEPKQNRLLLFDGAYYHASSCPKHHDYRMVITINYHDKVYE